MNDESPRNSDEVEEEPWRSEAAEASLDAYGSDLEAGLSDKKADANRGQYGENRLTSFNLVLLNQMVWENHA